MNFGAVLRSSLALLVLASQPGLARAEDTRPLRFWLFDTSCSSMSMWMRFGKTAHPCVLQGHDWADIEALAARRGQAIRQVGAPVTTDDPSATCAGSAP